MELIRKFIDIVLHLDKYLKDLVPEYGVWIYAILFVIVFCETGLVVTPVLPGDSLLFTIGALAGAGALNLFIAMGALILAALCGDNVNYWIGYFVGPKVFRGEARWLNRKHLDRTHEFYERYGGKTIIIARFVPIVRTFTPFVAGLGRMNYGRFLSFSVFAAFLWVLSVTLAGYFFGGLEIVKKNFSAVVIAIVLISIMPAVIEYLRERRRLRSQV
ncbi:MAG TPA: DedA family protein [Verrucomicrobiae bacterium]|nr:DedA family protein [Verrucomicrobiae bacterium]